MDRFQPILEGENLCFLCLKPADNLFDKSGVPYCSDECLSVHYNAESNYCYPFRVLQRPGVSCHIFSVLITILCRRASFWLQSAVAFLVKQLILAPLQNKLIQLQQSIYSFRWVSHSKLVLHLYVLVSLNNLFGILDMSMYYL